MGESRIVSLIIDELVTTLHFPLQHQLGESFPASDLKVKPNIRTEQLPKQWLQFHDAPVQEMLDSVGIRLPKYKVRELGLSLETSGDITQGIIDKLLFVKVG